MSVIFLQLCPAFFLHRVRGCRVLTPPTCTWHVARDLCLACGRHGLIQYNYIHFGAPKFWYAIHKAALVTWNRPFEVRYELTLNIPAPQTNPQVIFPTTRLLAHNSFATSPSLRLQISYLNLLVAQILWCNILASSL